MTSMASWVVAASPTTLDVIDSAEQGPKALPEDHVVVDDDHADRRHGSTGIRALKQGPAIRRGAQVEYAAEGLDPAAHGGYANPAHVRLAQSDAVVCYPHNQLTGVEGHGHLAVRGVGMSDHVVQRLEHNQVGSLPHRRRQRSSDLGA